MSSFYPRLMTQDLPEEVRFLHWVLDSSDDVIWARIQSEGITTGRFARECLEVADGAAAYGHDFQAVQKLRRWATNLLEELKELEDGANEDIEAP